MPVIKSAKKKLRQDKKRTLANKKIRELLKKNVKLAVKKLDQKSMGEAFSVIDKAVKKNIIHRNKAAHLKSQLAKKLSSKTPKTTVPKKTTPKAKKSAKK